MSVPLYQAKAEFFRTLGHPGRIRILELLSEREHAVHDLLDRMDIEPSNLSQQLAVLRRAGLVSQRRHGGEVLYSVGVEEVRDLLLAARRILLGLIEDRDLLKPELGGAAAAETSSAPGLESSDASSPVPG
ncbi:MAG: helix-turn-helix transcriptional regulator [Chloroflexi bacterium]|nr:helix-turn-helix transcriptional regulator [Chloroflexota bacterium]